MTLYLLVISGSMLCIVLLNMFLGIAPVGEIVSSTFLAVFLVILIDGAVALITHLMPNQLFSPDNSHYYVSPKSQRIYRKLGVRRWKDKVWELGALGGFSKKHLADTISVEYIERFIIECNKGVFTHTVSCFTGLLIRFAIPDEFDFTIVLPVVAVNMFLNVLPTIILRDNTPKLQSLLKHLKLREERASVSLPMDEQVSHSIDNTVAK